MSLALHVQVALSCEASSHDWRAEELPETGPEACARRLSNWRSLRKASALEQLLGVVHHLGVAVEVEQLLLQGVAVLEAPRCDKGVSSERGRSKP